MVLGPIWQLAINSRGFGQLDHRLWSQGEGLPQRLAPMTEVTVYLNIVNLTTRVTCRKCPADLEISASAFTICSRTERKESQVKHSEPKLTLKTSVSMKAPCQAPESGLSRRDIALKII